MVKIGKNNLNKNLVIKIFIFVCLFLFLAVPLTHAQKADIITEGVGTALATVLSWIAYVFIMVFGYFLTLIIDVLVNIAQVNNIISVPAVVSGWVIVRDLCNMSFVLILLVISFATILRQENYSAKKLLPKLLIMAVLINFSRTIFGVIIDFSQVIMLTFVNAFATNGPGNFVSMFSTQQIMSLWKGENKVSSWTTVASIILGVIAFIITFIVVLVILAVLIIRIVMLWIYTLLSPVIFLGFAFPPLQKYTSKFWEDFIKQVTVGPILAFFLWLALSTAASSSNAMSIASSQEVCAGMAVFFCSSTFQTFLITIGLLMGGLMIAQQMGGAVGSIAGKGMGWAKKVAGAPLGAAALATKFGIFKAGRTLDDAQSWMQKKLGVERPISLNYRMIAEGWKRHQANSTRLYEAKNAKAGRWRDVFQKNLDLDQYRTIRKGSKAYAEDVKKAGNLRFRGDVLKNNASIYDTSFNSPDFIKAKNIFDAKGGEAGREKEYLDRKYSPVEAKKWAHEDAEVFKVIDDDERRDEAKKTKKEADDYYNKHGDEIRHLEDPRIRILQKDIWPLLSATTAGRTGSQYKYKYTAEGESEAIDKEMKEISARTGEESFAVISELLEGYAKKDTNAVISAFRILTKKNDMNEALKDQRIIDLLTKENGLLGKMIDQGAFGKEAQSVEAKSKIINDYKENPVTPAYAHALVRGMLGEIGMSKDSTARQANTIGQMSFAAGAGLNYAMVKGNAITGNFEFDKVHYNEEEGGLDTSVERKAAIAFKFANLESQDKIKHFHPDLAIAEGPDGRGTKLTGDGKFLLTTVNENDMTQLQRSRGDFINKVGGNPRVVKSAKEFYTDLKDNKRQELEAERVRLLIGYLRKKYEGAGGQANSKDKILEGAAEAFDKPI